MQRQQDLHLSLFIVTSMNVIDHLQIILRIHFSIECSANMYTSSGYTIVISLLEITWMTMNSEIGMMMNLYSQ